MAPTREMKIGLQVDQYRQRYGRLLSLEQVALLTGVSPRTIRRLALLEIVPFQAGEQGPLLDIELLPRVRKALRLHYDLAIGWAAMALVLDLLDRLEQLDAEFRARPFRI